MTTKEEHEPISYEMLQKYKDNDQERHERDMEEMKQFSKYNQEQYEKAWELAKKGLPIAD